MNAEEKKKYDRDLELRHWREKKKMKPEHIAPKPTYTPRYQYPITADAVR